MKQWKQCIWLAILAILTLSLNSATAQFAPTDDFDGDGVTNDVDLDDDNDGILDTDENCLASGVLDFNNLAGATATPGNDTTVTTVVGGNTLNITLHADSNYTSIEADGAGAFSSRDSLGNGGSGIVFFPNGIGSTASGNTLNVSFSNPVANLTFQITDVDKGNGTSNETMTIDAYLDGNLITLTSNDYTVLHDVPPLFSNNTFSGVDAMAGDGSFVVKYSQAVDSVVFKHSITTNDPNYANIARLFDFMFDNIEDLDGDGLPDCMDLDSDGDGCPDAIEGGGSHLYADLEGSGALGGYIAATGVPVIAGSGQTAGSSTDSSVVVCCDATVSGYPDIDGDGVADDCDLDKDNDGILNSDENCYASGALDFNSLAGATATPGNDTTVTTVIDGNTLNITLKADSNYTAIEADGQGAFWNRDSLGNGGSGIVFYPNGINSTANGSTLNIGFSNPVANLTFQITDVDKGNGTSNETMTIDAYLDGNLIALTSNDYTVLHDVPPLFSNNTFSGVNAMAGNGSFVVHYSQNVDSIVFKHSITSNDPNYANIARLFDLMFDNIEDLDGDGIPDCEDTDADGDGCPDAIEGDGDFTAADVQNDMLTGGVAADGVPLATNGTTQGIGDAQDSTKYDACFTTDTLYTAESCLTSNANCTPLVVCGTADDVSSKTTTGACEPTPGYTINPTSTPGCLEFVPDSTVIDTAWTCIYVCDSNGNCDTSVLSIPPPFTAASLQHVSSWLEINDCKVTLHATLTALDAIKSVELERASNRFDFASISDMEYDSYNSDDQNLKYVDNSLNAENNKAYYRIKLTNHNGEVSYTPVLEASTNCQSYSDVSIKPNPTRGAIKVHGATNADNVQINIYNGLGQLLISKYVHVSNQQLNEQIDLSTLPKGIYHLSIQNADTQETIQILKVDKN